MCILKEKFLLVCLASVFLFGCATNMPAKLGISELEWTSYSQEKQKNLIASYERISEEHKKILKKQNNYKNASSVFLSIKIHDGKIMFPPSFINWQGYKPVRFDIFPEECNDIEMVNDKNHDLKTTLRVCFYKNILYLDASRYDLDKKHGSVSIYYSPLWESGFTYQEISSSGYVRLNNVYVEVKQHGRT